MTSFGYRLNPRYAIKECSSCGTLYTRDHSCSKGNVEDKILVPKPPKNYARCGHPVDGLYCQGCTFLQKKLEEDLVTHFQGFQNTSESSDDSTNVVNIPLEPFVVKQDHGSFVDKINCCLNKALDSPHLHTFSPNQFHCFHYKDALGDGEASQRCTCKRGPHKNSQCQPLNYYEPNPSYDSNYSSFDQFGWNRPAIYNNGDDDDVDYTNAITPVLSTEEPDNSLNMRDEHLDTIPATKSDEVIKSSVEDLVPIPSEFKAKDHFGIVINSNDDYSSSNEDSLYENIEYVEASPHDSELVGLEVEKIVIPEDEEIEDDNLRKKLLKVNLLIAEIEALKHNLTPSCEFLTKSSSTSPKSFLEETNTFDNSLPEFENFYFDLEEISSGSTTTPSNISLSEYDSFIFDLSNDQFPPTDRSDFTYEEFGDEPAHIISPPEYDYFYFRDFPDSGEFISSLNFGIRENLYSTTCVNLPVEDDYFPLLAYVVWIFLAYLTYPVIPPHLHSFENEDTIFEPGITINRSYSFKPGLSHR
nr:hypothetical protein [Tanacetum cinerariifolium]